MDMNVIIYIISIKKNNNTKKNKYRPKTSSWFVFKTHIACVKHKQTSFQTKYKVLLLENWF